VLTDLYKRDGDGQPSLWIAPAAVVLGLAGGIFVTLLIEIAGSAFGASLNHPPPAVELLADLFFDLSFVAAALYFVVLRGWMGRSEFGYKRIPLRAGVVAVVLAGVAYYAVTYVYGLLVTVHGSDKLPSELGVTHSTAAAIGAAVFVCVAAPICEEFFFRGFLFGVLRRMRVRAFGREIGPVVAALIVGLLFGLAHFDSAHAVYLVPLGFLGFVLCMVRWRTDSLYPCMALHSLNNSIAMGVNELGWGAGLVVALAVASLLVVGLLTLPLSAHRTTAS
jgi:membrane protease YdiL (CAAX protease family)